MNGRALPLAALAGLSVAAYAPAPLPKPDAGKAAVEAELKKLHGTWVVVRRERAGKPLSAAMTRDLKVVITGDRFVYQYAGKTTTEWAITLSPGKGPKKMDLKREGKGTLQKGIYLLQGDVLKFCYVTGKAERPTDLTTEGKPRTILLVLRRERP
jgi:uncharacterized protein (TIGR03067 family)